MKPEYHRIYDKLFNSFQFYPYPFRDPIWRDRIFREDRNLETLVEDIKADIMELERGLNLENASLRSDAKYLLLLNIIEMIIVPILFGEKAVENVEDLHRRAVQDMKTIVNYASKSNNKAMPISSHAILQSLSDNWNKLSLMELGVWGDLD